MAHVALFLIAETYIIFRYFFFFIYFVCLLFYINKMELLFCYGTYTINIRFELLGINNRTKFEGEKILIFTSFEIEIKDHRSPLKYCLHQHNFSFCLPAYLFEIGGNFQLSYSF